MDEYIFGIDVLGERVYGFDSANMTILDLYKEGDTGLYAISFETLLEFDCPDMKADFIDAALGDLCNFISDIDIVESYTVKVTDNISIGYVTGKTIGEVFEKFRFIANAYIQYYRSI